MGQTWMDEKPAFDTVDEAKQFIAEKIDPTRRTRLMLVKDDRRSPLPEEGME